MLIALKDGERILATPRDKATCQDCSETVRSKCGEIMMWHWAHMAGSMCESSSQGMTKWHLEWLGSFDKDCIEVSLTDNEERHRADVLFSNGKDKAVIEFQRKMMPVSEMIRRESFWRRTGHEFAWVFDCVEAYDSDRLRTWEKTGIYGSYATFKWKRAPASLEYIKTPYYLDIGGGWMLKVKKLYGDRPFGGWGIWRKYDFFTRHNKDKSLCHPILRPPTASSGN